MANKTGTAPVKQKVVSLQTLSEKGISASLNQNDIAEIIGNEVFEKEKALIEEFNKRTEKIYEEAALIKEELIEKAIDLCSDFPDIGETDRAKLIASAGVSFHDSGYQSVPTIYHNGKKLSYPNRGLYMPVKTSKATVILTVDFDVLESVRSKVTRTFKSSSSCKVVLPMNVYGRKYVALEEKLDSLTKEAEVIMARLGNSEFSAEAFTKKARLKVNKKILAGTDGDLVQILSDTFGISL